MLIQIPMFGKKNSLNVAACAPVVLYEVLRQWGVMEKQQNPHG
jgi:tRNA G18 (ribose-2'-O)-methylase SpoU